MSTITVSKIVVEYNGMLIIYLSDGEHYRTHKTDLIEGDKVKVSRIMGMISVTKVA